MFNSLIKRRSPTRNIPYFVYFCLSTLAWTAVIKWYIWQISKPYHLHPFLCLFFFLSLIFWETFWVIWIRLEMVSFVYVIKWRVHSISTLVRWDIYMDDIIFLLVVSLERSYSISFSCSQSRSSLNSKALQTAEKELFLHFCWMVCFLE